MATNTQVIKGPTQPEGYRWLNLVREQVDSLHYGVVQIPLHNSRVIQIERTEKLRPDKSEQNSSSTSGFAVGNTVGSHLIDND